MKEERVVLELPPAEQLLSPEEVQKKLRVPEGFSPDSRVIVYLGQPRCGSTAIACAWGNFDWLRGKVHFQPWKFLQRYGKELGIDSLELFGDGQNIVVALKETPGGPNHYEEIFDPVEILLNAGVPAEIMRVVVVAREPVSQFESWLKFDTRRRVDVYLAGQEFVLNRLAYYRHLGINAVPLVFEMFYSAETRLTKSLFEVWGFDLREYPIPDELSFNKASIMNDVCWHEARSDSHYFETVVAPVIERGKFELTEPRIFTSSNLPYWIAEFVSQEDQSRLLKEGRRRYLSFARETVNFWKAQGFSNRWFDRYLKELEVSLDKD